MDRIREESATFLRKFTIDTYYEKGYDKSGHRLRKITSDFGYILPEVQREFEKSTQWHQFEDVLLAVAEEQAEQEGTDRNSGLVFPLGADNGADPHASMEDVKARKGGIASPINWSDLTITFISDERVMIERPGPQRETCNYGEMGFEDQRGGKPRAAWIDLREMSGQNGEPRHMDKKRAQEIRSLLKSHFSIISDPLIYQKGLGYSARFKLGRRGSFNS